MSRYFITGDVHGEIGDLAFAARVLDKEDTLIVLGDFGFIWRLDTQDVMEELSEVAKKCPCQIAFVDGNHENFNKIKELEEITEWNGGKVGKLPFGILHLLRGEIYNLNNEKVGVIGGADSVDKWGRTEDISWWSAETVTAADAEKLIENAKDVEDLIILSHDAPSILVNQLKMLNGINGMTEFSSSQMNLQKVYDNVSFKKWCFGHWHIDKELDERFECFYHNIDEIA
jgi:hypothetical protein